MHVTVKQSLMVYRQTEQIACVTTFLMIVMLILENVARVLNYQETNVLMLLTTAILKLVVSTQTDFHPRYVTALITIAMLKIEMLAVEFLEVLKHVSSKLLNAEFAKSFQSNYLSL